MNVENLCIGLFLFCLLSYSEAFSASLESPNIDPSKVYSLTIDGVVHKVVADKNSRILIDGKYRDISFQSPAISVFEKYGLKFQYNSNFRFDYRPLDNRSNMWFLIGDRAVLTIAHYLPGANLDVFIKNITNGYDNENIEYNLSESEFLHQENIVSGVKLLALTSTGYQEHQFFHFIGEESHAIFMLFDSPQDQDKNSTEFLSMKELLESTLTLEI